MKVSFSSQYLSHLKSDLLTVHGYFYFSIHSLWLTCSFVSVGSVPANSTNPGLKIIKNLKVCAYSYDIGENEVGRSLKPRSSGNIARGPPPVLFMCTHMCVCAFVCRCLQNPEEGVGSPGAGVARTWSWLTCILSTELGSSVRAECTFNNKATLQHLCFFRQHLAIYNTSWTLLPRPPE